MNTETPHADPRSEAADNPFGPVLDPFGILASQARLQQAWLAHPAELTRAAGALGSDGLRWWMHALQRLAGLPVEPAFPPHPDDTRFADPAWTEGAGWDVLKQGYLALTRRLQDLALETPGLSEHERRRAAFWQRTWLNMLAPTNFFWLNPAAMARSIETDGRSLAQGWTHFLRHAGQGGIPMVEPDAFTVGRDLATTPGQVIFRNRLVELIHYTPTTARTRAMPVVIVTPWINKFYILDLTEKKSLIRFLLDQGFPVFITSWKNPTAEMRDVRLDDYLLEGVHAVVEQVRAFCRVPQVHLVGYCLGGTLSAIYMAWNERRRGRAEAPVAHWTLFTTLTDFSHPGEIEAFIDEDSIAALEALMARKGYLDGSEMAASFRLLRSNSLIWNYWVQSYLLGEPLPRFDVLFWNMDSTRMPQAMHGFYLRELYLRNKLARPGGLQLAGESIDLGLVTQPLYAVTAEDDHVAPWHQCFRIRGLLNPRAPVRFVRSSAGHVLGIVNPPVSPPKRSYRIGDARAGDDADAWLARAGERSGSWWPDWAEWLHERCGDWVPAYPAHRRGFPALADAPGTYVLEK